MAKVTSLASRRAGARAGGGLSGVEPLRISNRRRSRVAVHARLRQLILDGTLPPGSVLSQLQLSQALGVSRTPLREALRMLQEEGLVDAELNQRARVKGFDSSDLESVYSTRILLESFGVALTIPTLGPDDVATAEEALAKMRTAIRREDFAEWRSAHREFHLVLVRGAGDHLVQLIDAQAERAERYLRFYQLRDTRAWWSRDTETEHRDLLEAITEGQAGGRDGVAAIGRHLARTALWVIAEAEPERDPLPIRLALQLALSAATADRATWPSAPGADPAGRGERVDQLLSHIEDSDRLRLPK
jgi:DNA-binding GntR family transcriptional regulator